MNEFIQKVIEIIFVLTLFLFKYNNIKYETFISFHEFHKEQMLLHLILLNYI